MKTANLIGPALDYAVRILVEKVDIGQPLNVPVWNEFLVMREAGDTFLMPSTDWDSGGPIIEREKIDVENIEYLGGDSWGASTATCNQTGPTPLIAAMRCHVASKLGDEIEIPKELLA